MKSDHAPLTVGIIGPLSVTLFKYTERLLQCMAAIWAPVKVNTRHEFCSLILLLMSCVISHPSRDKDYHLRTYKSVVMANKLIDWLIAQVSHEDASSTSHRCCQLVS